MSIKKTFLSCLAATIIPSAASAQDSIRTYDIEEVIVTASQMQLSLKNTPQKVEIISQAQLRAIPNENLGDVLKRTVNLDVIQYPGAMTTVGLRGFPATAHSRNYTLLLIDGLPAGTNNLATIPTNTIDRIEVVKGPYSVLYGSDAMGGVINIITKKNSEETSGNVGFSVGNFGQTSFTGNVSGAISPKLFFALGFSRQDQNTDYRIGSKNLAGISETQEHILDKKSYGDVMTNTKYQINQFNWKLEYAISSKWNAKLHSILTVSNDIETPGNYWHSYGLSKKDISRIANYGEVKYTEGDNELTISPYLSMQKEANYNNNTDTAFIDSKERVRQYGVKVMNMHTWGDLKWLIGLDIDDYRVSSEKFSSKLTPSNPYRPDHNRLSTSGFTQLAYTWNDLSLNAGLRYNYISYTLEANTMLKNGKETEGYSNLNPSLGVKYHLTDELSLHGSFGSAFYVPDAYKSAGVYMIGKKTYIGNKDLKPETNTSFDLGVSYNLGEYINLDLSYFRNFYKNKIVNDNQMGKDTVSYKNVGEGKMDGLEFMVSSNIAGLWNAPYKLKLYGGFTQLFDNNFDDKQKNDKGEQVSVTKKTLYARDFTANFGVNFLNATGFEATLNARYSGTRLENDWMVWDNLRPDIKAEHYYAKDGYTSADQILKHADYIVLDFSSYYTFKNKIRVGMSISNLLDENYSEKDGYNMPGRSVMGHVSYNF